MYPVFDPRQSVFPDEYPHRNRSYQQRDQYMRSPHYEYRSGDEFDEYDREIRVGKRLGKLQSKEMCVDLGSVNAIKRLHLLNLIDNE